ncbi:YesL family protein [Halobacillus mangrovi]|uniref:YesL family protein n=1 Tax=Halobacillus mangrovi TaxID=402384 RepID=UPI003D952E74
MNIFQNNWFRALDVIVNFFLLNMVWLVFCTPVVTIFPATKALYSVVRKWQRDRDYVVVKPFWKFFKEGINQTMKIGAVWIMVGVLLVLDYILIDPSASSFHLLLFIVTIILTFMFVIVSTYLFPVIAHVDTDAKNTIRNAVMLTFSYPGTTFLLAGTMAIALYLLITFPISILLLGSVGAYFIYYLCNRVFETITHVDDESRQGSA